MTMADQDILIKMTRGIFSYRVAGVLIQAGKVLLQRTKDDPGYAFPGGHVGFGEISTETLAREFKEEICVDIIPGRLLWIGEIFFPWGDQPCHQISLYYLVTLVDETQIPLEGVFSRPDEPGIKRSHLEFCWIPLSEIKNILVYPAIAKDKLLDLSEHIEAFVDKQ
jgi:ADP-ribose pyrophosphatase YjhB (NUDIX family)